MSCDLVVIGDTTLLLSIFFFVDDSERVEKQLEDLTAKSEKKKGELAQLQMQFQQARTQAQ